MVAKKKVSKKKVSRKKSFSAVKKSSTLPLENPNNSMLRSLFRSFYSWGILFLLSWGFYYFTSEGTFANTLFYLFIILFGVISVGFLFVFLIAYFIKKARN